MFGELDKSGPFIAVGGLAVAFFLYAYTAIVLPGWWNSVALPVLWLSLTVLATRWFSTRPRASVLLPIVALVAWFTVVLLVPQG